MASQQDDAVFHDIDDESDVDRSSHSHDDNENDDEEDDLEEEDEDDEEELEDSGFNLNSSVVPLAVPSSSSAVTVASAPPKHRPLLPPFETILLPNPKPQDETRRLFQRLWTDEDEIELLRGFLHYTTQRGGGSSHDTSLFYDQIKSKLQLDFNKNQLVEKLRRLKKKFRNVMGKISSGKDFSFKSPHDQETFEISKKIWSSIPPQGKVENLDEEDCAGRSNYTPNLSRKRPRLARSGGPHVGSGAPVGVKIEENCNHNDGGGDDKNNGGGGGGNVGCNVSVSGVIEETVKSCVSPLVKELLGGVVGTGGLFGGRGVGGLVANAAVPWGFGGGGEVMMVADERWRKQYILELEVYSKRLELVQDQIRAQLEELRSMGGGNC